MARTGNFGRQPRSSPSITNTLISIAREQQAREDNNIMDAWQKGGLVAGEKVTDEMVLAHWKQRLVDIDEEDPLYDTYSNSVLQLEYTVAQSKMTAAYALIVEPSSGDNMKMANFFLNWAKKVPKNSEFYRVLQRDAGQYLRAAKARKVAVKRVDTEKIYRGQMSALESKNERAGQTALRVITLLAQEGTVIGENPLGQPSDIAQRSNLGTVRIEGVEQLMSLLGAVMSETNVINPATGFVTGSKSAGANKNVLYTDENGQAVTGSSLVATFKKLDPSFNGKFDLAYVQGAIASARDGIDKRIKLARKTGHVAEASSLSLEQAKLNEFSRQVDAYPVAAEYNDLRKQMQDAVSDPTLLPDAKVSLIQSLRNEMGKLANDPRIEADTRMQTQLRGEAEGRAGVPTLGEDLSGEAVGYSDNIRDNDVINDHLEQYMEQKDRIDSGEAVYTQGIYEKDPLSGKTRFVPKTNGPEVGAASMAEINNLPGVGQPQLVMVPNGDGGGSTPMYVVPSPIHVRMNDASGNEMPASNKNPAGSFISYMMNGKAVTLYSIQRNGTADWTTDPPWDASQVKVDPQRTNGVMTVTMTATPDLSKIDHNKVGAVPGMPGFSVVGATQNANGTWNPGTVVFQPTETLLATDMSRNHAGTDPNTDSFSASLAAVKDSPDGNKLLNQWTGDERFNFILDHNAHMSAGQTFNPATGAWDGGDPSEYARNLNTMKTDIDAAKKGNLGTAVVDGLWRKESADLSPDGIKPFVNRPQYDPNDPFAAPKAFEESRLPSTFIQQNPTARFQALGFGYVPGTNSLANKSGSPDDRMTLTTGLNLKLPTYTPPVIPKSVTPPPASTIPNVSTNPNVYTPPAYTPPSSYTPTPSPTGTGYTDATPRSGELL